MSIDRVAVTGGNGRIGGAILRELGEQDYYTINIDREKRGNKIADEYRKTDLLDAGAVYSSLSLSEADAVIHMGTIPAPTEHPAQVTYESNVMTTYHILEASKDLSLESVCLASSINAMGSVYQEAPIEIDYLPVDEDHPRTPRDPYALGKHALEITADGFGRLKGPPCTISSLRYPWVAYSAELREAFTEADRSLDGLKNAWHHTTRDVLFSYIHVEDAATLATTAIQAQYDGHEIFWAVADDTTAEIRSRRLIEEFYPTAEVQGSVSGHESLISNRKAKRMLDWSPKLTWRNLDV